MSVAIFYFAEILSGNKILHDLSTSRKYMHAFLWVLLSKARFFQPKNTDTMIEWTAQKENDWLINLRVKDVHKITNKMQSRMVLIVVYCYGSYLWEKMSL